MPDLDVLLQSVIQKQVRKAIYVFMALLIVYVVVRATAAAAAKPLWLDELQTLAVAQQPGVRGMWIALSRLIDSQPIAFHIVERLAMNVIPNQEIALRVPSILGFCCTLLCVFVIVKRRSGELIAAACVLLLFWTTLFHIYLIEARAYSLTVACLALGLVCYQRVPSPFWTTMLGASLFGAESLHYYAIFAMIPFWVAEIAVTLETRKIRWRVLASLSGGVLPLIVSWPWLVRFREYYGTHFFSKPVLSALPDYYGSYFVTDGTFGLGLALLAAFALAWPLLWSRLRETIEPNDLAERIVLLGFVALPLIGFVLARLTHGGLSARYLLPTVIGIVVALSYLLSSVSGQAIAVAALLIFLTFSMKERSFWRTSEHDLAAPYSAFSPEQLVEVQKFIQSDSHRDLPVVFGRAMFYSQVVHYCPPDFTRRLIYLTDEDKEVSYEGTDIIVKIYSRLREFFPLRIADYTEFTSTHNEFLLYSEGLDWTLVNLNHDAASMQLLKIEGDRWLFLVRMKGNPTAAPETRGFAP